MRGSGQMPIRPAMSTERRRQSAAGPVSADRRQSRRVDVYDRLSAFLMPQNQRVPVLNVSLGGFLIRMAAPWSNGDVHTFLFIGHDSTSVALRAQVVHSMRVTTNGSSSYVIGLEFLDQDDATCQAAIDSLMRVVTG